MTGREGVIPLWYLVFISLFPFGWLLLMWVVIQGGWWTLPEMMGLGVIIWIFLPPIVNAVCRRLERANV